MPVHPYPNEVNVTGFADIATYANTVTQGWFWSLVLIALFIVLILSMKKYTTDRALAPAAFIILLVATMMFSLGLVGSQVIGIAIALLAVGIVWLWKSDEKK